MTFSSLRRIGCIAVLVGIASLGLSSPAHASLDPGMQLSVSDSLGNSIVVDSAGNTVNVGATVYAYSYTPAGTITLDIAIGNYSLNVDIGDSKPDIGSPTFPQMDLSSIVSSKGADTLTIKVTDLGFGPTPKPFTSTVGGTLSGPITSASFQTIVDPGNTEFGTGALAIKSPVLTFTTNPFSGGNSVPNGALANPYSVTLVAKYVSTGAGGSASADYHTQSTPEPATMIMAFSGLPILGLYLVRRRRSK